MTDTWPTMPKRLVSANRNACLVHIYPSGPNMGQRFQLGDAPVVVGRGDDCDVRIADNSVSRRHARIVLGADGYYIEDLRSTNGTFINDTQTNQQKLHDGDYLRISNYIYRYLAGGNIEAEYHEEIYRMAIFDGLTQIHNQRYLMEFLDRELIRSARHNRPLALALFDIDHFKSVNDDHGHLGGDYALREIANLIKHNVRREDLFARYGGEEFALVLVETQNKEAFEVAERLRLSIQNHPFHFDRRDFKITLSIGVASTAGDHAMTTAELIRLADQRLYAAKRGGRNRVVWS